jgi:hypothetical protein
MTQAADEAVTRDARRREATRPAIAGRVLDPVNLIQRIGFVIRLALGEHGPPAQPVAAVLAALTSMALVGEALQLSALDVASLRNRVDDLV